jgi:DNA (cytosine-5)-methyltransferase 1
VQRDSSSRRTPGQSASADAEGCAGTVSSKWAKGTGGPAGDKCYNLTTQPIGYRWQNNRDGLQQDDAVAAMRASTGSSGFHEMNHPVVVAHAFYSTGGTHGVNQHSEVSPAVKVGSGGGGGVPPAVAFTRCDNGQDAAVDHTPTMRCGSNYSAHLAVAHALRGEGFDASEDGSGRGTPLIPQAMTVRRLTARECERLQAFPDDYTLIPWRKKQAEDCPDGPRYKALGNSMAVNCMAWIGERIAALENNR